MKKPKIGDVVRYMEKIPQDNGVPAILQDVDAKVIAIYEDKNVACIACHDRKAEHDRPERKHTFEPQENTLVLDVSFSARGRKKAQVLRREHVEHGKLANQWYK